jgi:hypothetical protein
MTQKIKCFREMKIKAFLRHNEPIILMAFKQETGHNVSKGHGMKWLHTWFKRENWCVILKFFNQPIPLAMFISIL